MKNSEFAELIAYIAKRMYMCGAETRLIVQTSERVAKAYGHQASVVVTPGFRVFILCQNRTRRTQHA